MMNKFKKISIFIVLTILIIPINANAKTLGQLKKEYSDLESKYNTNSNNIQATEAEITAAKARVQSIYKELETAEKEIQKINDEITKLNEDILEKDKELKELMKFFQASQGESTYLEYIFKADSITDFIYRVSVTEQLTKYNDELIEEMNEMIVKNKKNIEELHKKEESLKVLQNELNDKMVVLASERDKMYDENLTIKDELAAQKSILDYYVKAGCKDNEDISSCGGSQLPPGTKFWRPLSSGCMTSNYGYRYHPISGRWKMHTGLDIACGDRKVYSMSDGKVKVAKYGWNGGYGNYIIIHHNINGRKYSSLYAHLSSINVSQGDVVTKDSQIGIMGTSGSSTGVHLHFSVYTGLYLEPGESYSLVDPRDYINFPYYDDVHYTYFYDRTSYYK